MKNINFKTVYKKFVFFLNHDKIYNRQCQFNRKKNIEIWTGNTMHIHVNNCGIFNKIYKDMNNRNK